MNATGLNLVFLQPPGGSTGNSVSKALEGLESALEQLKKACDGAKSATQGTQNSPPGLSLEELLRTLFGQGGPKGADAGQGADGGQGAGAGQGADASQGAGAGQGADASQGPEASQGADGNAPAGDAQGGQEGVLKLLTMLVELLQKMQGKGAEKPESESKPAA